MNRIAFTLIASLPHCLIASLPHCLIASSLAVAAPYSPKKPPHRPEKSQQTPPGAAYGYLPTMQVMMERMPASPTK